MAMAIKQGHWLTATFSQCSDTSWPARLLACQQLSHGCHTSELDQVVYWLAKVCWSVATTQQTSTNKGECKIVPRWQPVA